MYLVRATAFAAFIAVSSAASKSTAFVAGGSCVQRQTASEKHHERFRDAVGEKRMLSNNIARGVRSLQAAGDGKEESEGGFVNPYTAFRKWQMDLIDSKAKSNDKYPEAYEGLMKEPGMTPAKAERLAKLAVSDPILYSIERRKEANEINKTKMDYRKIDGFFPMEWILSGDFGWGFNKKRARLAAEKKAAAEEKRNK